MLQPESYRRGGISSILFLCAGQGLALVFNVVMVSCFGAIAATDVFNYCTTTFALLAGFMLALDSTVLIPEAMRRMHQESQESAMRFLNFFLYVFMGIVLAISVCAAVIPVEFLTLISRFDAELLNTNRTIIIWVIPTFALQLLAQYTNFVLVAHKYFSLPAKWGVVCRVFNIVFVLCFHRLLGLVALAQSLIIGLVIQIAVSLFLMRKHLGWRFGVGRPRIQASVWRNIAYTEAALLAVAFVQFSPVLMASAAQEGFVTAMNYAIRVAAMPEAILYGQVILMVGIKLNELAARKNRKEFSEFYERIARFLLWFCVPLVALLCVMAPDILRILFLHGAYTEDALRTTTVLFQGLILILPIFVFHAFFFQALAAQQKILQRNLLDVVLCIGIGICFWLFVPQIGILRYPLIKAAFMWGVYFVWMLLAPRLAPDIPLRRVYGALILNVAVNGALALVCWQAARFMQGWLAWLRLAATSILYATLFVGVHWIWKWDFQAWAHAKTLLRGGMRHVRNNWFQGAKNTTGTEDLKSR